jgi:SAM-dependent methyltransferase
MARDSRADAVAVNDYGSLAVYYDGISGDRTDEIRFYSDFVRPDRDCIDFGCGSGVITRALREAQAAGSAQTASCGRMVGVDSSAGMLALAAERAPDVEWIKADMRAFDGEGAFDLAVCCFNSLQHMLTLSDLRAALASMRRALRPGGEAVFDIFQPHPDFQPDEPRRWIKMALPGADPQDVRDLVETIAFDRENQILWIDWLLQSRGDGAPIDLGSFGMRHHVHDEVVAAIADSGFAIHALYGDYDRSAFRHDAPKQIFWMKAAL